jgi:hypothetical protein
MRISRVVIRGLKALVERDDSFSEDQGAAPLTSVCLRGLNGSGKTTYHEAIASIWQMFRRWSQRGTHVRPPIRSPLRHADLVAVHLTELPGPARALWLVYGRQSLWDKVPARDDPAAGVLWTGEKGAPKNLRTRSEITSLKIHQMDP